MRAAPAGEATKTRARPPFLHRLSFGSAGDSDLEAQTDDDELPLLARGQGRALKDDDEWERFSSSKPSPSRRPRINLSFSTSPSASAAASSTRKSRRASRFASLAYTSVVVCLAATSLLAVAVLGWSAHVFWQRHEAYSQSVFAPPMIPEPFAVEGRVAAFSGRSRKGGKSGKVSFAAAQRELDNRFRSLALPDSTSLTCADIPSTPTLLSRYSALQGIGSSPSHARSGPTFFALNLWNSGDVLPALSRTLLSVARFLGPDSVHISIFENGSTDNTTVALAHFAAALTALDIPHTIVSDPRKTDWKRVHRIAQLAEYRNVALAPLASAPYNTTTAPDDLVYINDVFVCPADVLELLFQRKVQDADAACAMDWRENGGLAKMWHGGVKFYDNWVTRSLDGRILRARMDLLSEWRDGLKELWEQPGEEYSRARFEKGLPIPVYSCWNGMLAMTAEPFLTTGTAARYNSIDTVDWSPSDTWARRRPQKVSEPTRFRSGSDSPGECAGSECKTLARDFWTRGYDRWLIVPTVRTTYALSTYTHPQLLHLSSLNPPSSSTLSLNHSSSGQHSLEPLAEHIDWPSLTPPTNVICFPWRRGLQIDIKWLTASWETPAAGRIAKWVGRLRG
ncbi:hypothetical protein JCM10207_008648 [Rhodosporidiobolus poonsookiae]